MTASAFNVVTVNSNYPGLQVVAASDPPQSVLVFNNDSSNTIYLASVNSINSGDINHSTLLQPKSSVTFDGTLDVFASTAAGQTAQLYLFPSGSSYSQGTGVTPLVQGGSIGGAPFQTLAPGTMNTVVNLADVSEFNSYDINTYFQAVNQSTAGAALTVQIRLQWFDDLLSGIPVFEEDWWPTAASVAAPSSNTLAGCGPMHGRYFTLIFQNVGTQNVFVQYLNVFGSPRSLPYSDWRQNGTLLQMNPNGWTWTAPNFGTGFDNLLASFNGTPVPASSQNILPISMYSGPVWINLMWNGQATAHFPVIVALDDVVSGTLTAGTGASNVLWTPNSNAVATQYQLSLFLPRSSCALLFASGAGGTTDIFFTVTAQQAA